MLNLLFILTFLLLGYSTQIEPAPSRIAYVIDSNCFPTDRNPTCPVEIGIFDRVTQTETRFQLTGQFIEPTTLESFPDGNEIAFSYLPSDEHVTQIATLNTISEEIQILNILNPGEANAGFSLSPDGQSLAYVVQTPQQPLAHNLTLYNLQTGESSIVLQDDYWTLSLEGWSPVQQAIAITAAPIDAELTNPEFDVHILNVLTGELTNLTPDERGSGNPSWSSNGELVAMVIVDQESVTTEIATISPAGDNFSVWANGVHLNLPQWALDDTALVYGEYGIRLPDNDRFWMLDLTDGEAEIIVDKSYLGVYALSDDGDWLAYLTRNDNLGDTILCTYNLRLRTDTCYPEIIVDENAFPIWLS